MNHRIFERILRSRLRPRACLPQRPVSSHPSPISPSTHEVDRRDQGGGGLGSPTVLKWAVGLPKSIAASLDDVRVAAE